MGSSQSRQTEAVLREAELFPGISRERRGLDDDVPGAAGDDDPTAYSAGILYDEDESLDFETDEGLAARDAEYARENHGAVPTRQSARESSAGATAAMGMARERERQAAIDLRRASREAATQMRTISSVILCAI